MSLHQNFHTTYTKIFVGGLPWVTRNEGLRSFFQQFGEITHVNVVCDKATDRSKGYGFVTFKDAESATRACVNQNPIIDGRTANCKLASDGHDNVNHTQSNITSFRNDDLCYLSQTFMRNQQQLANLHQQLPVYVEPYWNQHYQQYSQQWQHYAQYAPQYSPHLQYNLQNNYLEYSPHYVLQYDPQYYQNYFVVNTNTANQQHQSVNVSRENRAASRTSTSSSLPSTPRSSLE